VQTLPTFAQRKGNSVSSNDFEKDTDRIVGGGGLGGVQQDHIQGRALHRCPSQSRTCYCRVVFGSNMPIPWLLKVSRGELPNSSSLEAIQDESPLSTFGNKEIQIVGPPNHSHHQEPLSSLTLLGCKRHLQWPRHGEWSATCLPVSKIRI
jgi:hypothetical protein